MANPIMQIYERLTHRYLGKPLTQIIREDWYNPIWWLLIGMAIGSVCPWWLPLAGLPFIVLGHLWWGGGRIGPRGGA